MEALFQLDEVISVVCFCDVHDELGQSFGSSPAAGLLRCCRGEGGREGKKHKGGGGEEKRKRVHDIISPGLLRSSPVEG